MVYAGSRGGASGGPPSRTRLGMRSPAAAGWDRLRGSWGGRGAIMGKSRSYRVCGRPVRRFPTGHAAEAWSPGVRALPGIPPHGATAAPIGGRRCGARVVMPHASPLGAPPSPGPRGKAHASRRRAAVRGRRPDADPPNRVGARRLSPNRRVPSVVDVDHRMRREGPADPGEPSFAAGGNVADWWPPRCRGSCLGGNGSRRLCRTHRERHRSAAARGGPPPVPRRVPQGFRDLSGAGVFRPFLPQPVPVPHLPPPPAAAPARTSLRRPVPCPPGWSDARSRSARPGCW